MKTTLRIGGQAVSPGNGAASNGTAGTLPLTAALPTAVAPRANLRPSVEISPNDEMFAGSLDHYFKTGRKALESVSVALAAAQTGPPLRILDLPCGHGRVARYLRAAYPDAELVACDLNRDGVRFTAERLGAVPLVSADDPRDIALDGEFDLIWCGSLLTHMGEELWERFIDLFGRHLSPRGVMVFTVNGPETADLLRITTLRDPAGDEHAGLSLPSAVGLDRIHTARSYFPLPPASRQAMLSSYARSGFGYVAYDSATAYGQSVSSPTWVAGLIERFRDLRLVLYAEHSWDLQDVVACGRRATVMPRIEA